MDQIESFCENNREAFCWMTAAFVGLTLPLFVANLVHAYRGNRQKFVIIFSSLIIVQYLIYFCFIYEYAKNRENDFFGKLYYSLSLIAFEGIHWGIAYTYFECSSTSPYRGNHAVKAHPKPIKLRVIFVLGLLLIVVTGCFSFYNSETVRRVMFCGFATMLFLTMVMMLVALFRMNRTIGSSKRGKANTKRMASHAFAFIISVLAFIISKILENYYYYVTWLVCDLLISVSEIFLFILLWHLGTKERFKPLKEPVIQESYEPVLTNENEDNMITSLQLTEQVWASLMVFRSTQTNESC